MPLERLSTSLEIDALRPGRHSFVAYYLSPNVKLAPPKFQ